MGVTDSETSVGSLTVRTAEPLTEPELTVIALLPGAIAVARPVVVMLATPGIDEVQEAEAVMSWLVPSERVASAINCWVAPVLTVT